MTFRDLPIRRKLLLMTLASSATALALAAAGFLAWDIAQFRSEIAQDVAAQARILSADAGAAIVFGDRERAVETLRVMQIRPRVEQVCLYDQATRTVFADYQRDAGSGCPSGMPPRTEFAWSAYHAVEPVLAGDDRVGTLYIQRDLEDIYNRLRVGGATLLGLLLVAILAAHVIAARMQHSIASPLLQLADTARTISVTRDYSLRAVPMSNDEVGVVVYAFNDMLDRIAERTAELSQANERERNANRLKDEFLATLSHELRTPLNAVLGWTRVLRAARVEPATQARALESIERNARAQARLIEDLLEISRIVTGKLRLQVREADLAAIIEAAVEIVQPAATAKRLRLTVDIQQRPAVTAGDPDRLQQVVWNLLSNAVKFTEPDGQVTVRLERSGGYRLTVSDTGAGIEPRFLPYVFEAFRQADGTSSREHGGLGLGLAIAKQLVELHGGTIQARSAGRGMGATFEVVLPSVVIRRSPEVARSHAAEALDPDAIDATLLDSVRVLVVDDEEDARMLLETSLTHYGAEVLTAPSAAAAMERFDAFRPDVLVSDIGMPQEDGYSLIRRVRAMSPSDGGTVPAIAITAYASDADRQAAYAAGYQAHIAKPVEPAEVARVIARLALT